MLNELSNTKKKNLRGIIRELWGKSNNDQSDRLKVKNEQVMRLLQERYGYTREKAASELKKHYSKIIIY